MYRLVASFVNYMGAESAQQVKELGKIHKDLNKLAMEVNETFGELMLLRFSGDFIYLIVGLSSNAVLNAEYETVLDFVWTFTVYVLWIPMALGFIALTVWYFEDILHHDARINENLTNLIEATKQDYIFRYCFYTGFVFYGASDFTILVLITPVEKLYGHFLNNLENHNLEESVRVFFMLQDLAQSTFNIIEEFMLAKILIDFFYASTDVFYGTASALEVQTSLLATVLSSFIVVLWLLFVVHSIVTISFVFGKVKEQHQVMNEIICERFRSKAAKNYRCEAKLLLRGKVNPLKFTICGFLPLDYCLAYTVS
uniref:Olfactory receptor 6 n=1 Tax=Tribolium castaneum TaxID=7070 RepID=C0Z3Q4_TRICA|nr:olfactory receptor 6 [Tribolium castaneum]